MPQTAKYKVLDSLNAELVDRATFEQILELDDDEDREFSKNIVTQFFTQAEDTFRDMDSKINSKDLAKLSSLGHFLKGSSATLGLTKIRDSCERIQNIGARKDPIIVDDAKALQEIAITLKDMRADFNQIKAALSVFYGIGA